MNIFIINFAKEIMRILFHTKEDYNSLTIFPFFGKFESMPALINSFRGVIARLTRGNDNERGRFKKVSALTVSCSGPFKG